MAKRIGTQTYPSNVIKIMADRNLGKLFRAFAKEKLAHENTCFLDAVSKRFDPKKIYPVFIDPKGKMALNVDFRDREEAKQLAEAKDFKNTAWKDIMRTMSNECLLMLQQSVLPGFWKYEPFLKYHRARAEKKMGDPRKAAEILGVSDTRVLKSLMIAHAAGDGNEVKKMSTKLANTQELKKKKVKSNMIMKLLRKGKML